jgi:hypothetical protein
VEVAPHKVQGWGRSLEKHDFKVFLLNWGSFVIEPAQWQFFVGASKFEIERCRTLSWAVPKEFQLASKSQLKGACLDFQKEYFVMGKYIGLSQHR